MLFILCLCLKGEVEGCSVLLMCQEEGDLVQKIEKKRPLKRSGKVKANAERTDWLTIMCRNITIVVFLTESSEKKGGTTLNVLNKHYSCCQSAEDIGKWKISYQMFK